MLQLKTKGKLAMILLQNYFGEYSHIFIIGFGMWLMSISSGVKECKTRMSQLEAGRRKVSHEFKTIQQFQSTAKHRFSTISSDARRVPESGAASGVQECTAGDESQ